MDINIKQRSTPSTEDHARRASVTPSFRYSGHGTFLCRYTWLPKVVRNLIEFPSLFTDEDEAMMRLGVGKNMVRSIKFWAESADVICQLSSKSGLYEVTDFGRSIFGQNGYDEFLENIHTLWLIHWNIASRTSELPFAWYYLLNHWHRVDFTKSDVLAAFEQESQREARPLSLVTLDEHCTIFIRSYVTSHGKQSEDTLDCPLNELGLLEEVGDRLDSASGRREIIYSFRVEDKNDISPALFAYCLNDFWEKKYPNEKTLPSRIISGGIGSPGQIFKLPEHAVRERLETIERDSFGVFTYQESASAQQIVRKPDVSPNNLLQRIYEGN